MSTFKIRKKPVKPQRKRNDKHAASILYESLQYAIDLAKSWRAPFKECEIEKSYAYYDDEGVTLSWIGLESEVLFNSRMEEYERKLASYNEWEKINRETIKTELTLRKQAAKQKTQSDIENAIAKLEAKKKALAQIS